MVGSDRSGNDRNLYVVLAGKSDRAKNDQVVVDATLTAAKKGKASGRTTAISPEERSIKGGPGTRLDRTLLSSVINDVTFYPLESDSVRATD